MIPFLPKIQINSWQTSACFGNCLLSVGGFHLVLMEDRAPQNPGRITPPRSPTSSGWSFCKPCTSGDCISYSCVPRKSNLSGGVRVMTVPGASWADFHDVSTEDAGWGRHFLWTPGSHDGVLRDLLLPSCRFHGMLPASCPGTPILTVFTSS